MSAHDGYLLACVAGTVALLLFFVGRLRVHAAIGLSVAALALGIAAGIPLDKVPLTFTAGAGEMMGRIAIILGMGAILGQLLASSGAAAALGNAMVERCGPRGMPWALLCLGLLVGIPVFFEVGVVLLLPGHSGCGKAQRSSADSGEHPGAGRALHHARTASTASGGVAGRNGVSRIIGRSDAVGPGRGSACSHIGRTGFAELVTSHPQSRAAEGFAADFGKQEVLLSAAAVEKDASRLLMKVHA